jgi:hypothetical protein
MATTTHATIVCHISSHINRPVEGLTWQAATNARNIASATNQSTVLATISFTFIRTYLIVQRIAP